MIARPGASGDARLPLTGCIILPLALFVALMLATAGTALYPRLSHPGATLLCSGEVQYESHGASYRPGEYIVTREIYCASGPGKEEREEITFSAVGVSFLIYAVLAFLLIRFILYPLVRARAARTLAAAPGAADLHSILSRVTDAVERGGARVVSDEDEDGDPADRLARLKALRDQGLITAADYEAKKAEILSRL